MIKMAIVPLSLALAASLCSSSVAQGGPSAKLAPTPPMGWNSWNKFGESD